MLDITCISLQKAETILELSPIENVLKELKLRFLERTRKLSQWNPFSHHLRRLPHLALHTPPPLRLSVSPSGGRTSPSLRSSPQTQRLFADEIALKTVETSFDCGGVDCQFPTTSISRLFKSGSQRVIQDIIPSLTPHNGILSQFQEQQCCRGMMISIFTPALWDQAWIVPPC